MPGASGVGFSSIGRVYPESGANRERVRCNGMITNGGGQGARLQPRRTSSRWMACRRDFLNEQFLTGSAAMSYGRIGMTCSLTMIVIGWPT